MVHSAILASPRGPTALKRQEKCKDADVENDISNNKCVQTEGFKK